MRREGTKKCQKCDFSANFLNTSQDETNECVCAGGKRGSEEEKHAQKAVEGEKTALCL